MIEIERCVCGREADFLDPHLECPACGRAGWNVERWNHDMRGLRLLREVVEELVDGPEFMQYGWGKRLLADLRAWAKEQGDE